MTRASLSTCVLAGLAAAAVATTTQANSINLTFNGFGTGGFANIHYEAADSYNAATASSFNNVNSGLLNFSGNFNTYCVQIFEGLPDVGNSARWTTTALENVPDKPPAPGPMGTLKAQLVRDLYARHYTDSLTSNDKANAFQVVLWELTHENFDESGNDALALLAQASLLLGAFQLDATDSVFAQADSYLADLGDGGLKGYTLFGLTNETYQDLISVVPIPAPVLLAGVGLIGAAALRRRFKK